MINNRTRISTVRKFIKRILAVNNDYCGVFGIRIETTSGEFFDRFVDTADKVHYFQSETDLELYKQRIEHELYPDRLVDIHVVINSKHTSKELQKI